jgi:hypothetical protein
MAPVGRGRAERADSAEEEPNGRPGGWAERGLGEGAAVLVLTARVVRWVARLLALIIGLAIVFVVLDANAHNAIVSHVHGSALGLVGPFKDMFHLRPHKLALAVNWGVALAVYLLVGWLFARLLRGAAARVAPEG